MGGPAPSPAATSAAARLRGVVTDALAKHLHTSAVFFAEKLVTLTGAAPGDVFMLAHALYASKQCKRGEPHAATSIPYFF